MSRFGAEVAGLYRQGREDLLNNILPAFPTAAMTREAGAPGNPTQQQTTDALEKVSKEEVAQEMARMRGQEQERGR